MKKLLALCLALMMLFSVATVFAGCDDSSPKKSSKSSKKDDPEEEEIDPDEDDPDETDPDEDDPDETDPDEDDPDETDPDETDPEETEPEPTETEPEPTETEPEPTEPEPTETEPEPTEPDPTEVVLDPNNYFYNEENTFYEDDKISVRPLYVYWDEDGTLYAQCAVINGYANTLKDINITYLYIGNDDGTIAEASFGILNDLVLEPYQYVVWTFQFSGDTVKAFGADLYSLNYSNEYTANFA